MATRIIYPSKIKGTKPQGKPWTLFYAAMPPL